MSTPRIRPPLIADERTQLLGWLDLQRSIVAWKCEGVSDVDAYRPVLPASSLMTVAGLVSHLRWVEHTWFEVIFLGGSAETNPAFREDVEDADYQPDGVPLAQLVEEYERQCAVSNEIMAAHPLDDVALHEEYARSKGTLRWILLHMLEETGRHAGHLDVIRELLDGEKGYW